MITLRNPFLTCLALTAITCLSGSFLRAQETGEDDSKPRKLHLSFLLLHEKYEGMDVYLTDPENAESIGPIHIHGSDFSQPVIAPKGKYRMVLDPNSTLSDKKALCVLDLNEAKPRKLQVILEPHGKRLKPHFVNQMDKQFKVNSTRFFNTTDVPIAADLGGVKTVIPAHGNIVSPAPSRRDLPYYEVSFYYPQADGPPRKFECTRWPFRARGRNYTFFYVNPVTKGLSHKTVEEIVPQRTPG